MKYEYVNIYLVIFGDLTSVAQDLLYLWTLWAGQT